MTLLIIYVLIALVFSFVCSLLEATLLTLTPSNIASAKQKGLAWGKKMEKLKADVDKPLSAILTLNTIAHTMGAAGAGAQYARIYGDAAEAVFAGALTLAILIFTEIIPKTLGAQYALFFAGSVAWFLPKLIWILAPLVWLCRQITRLITFGRAGGKAVEREELLAMARLSEEVGAINRRESSIFKNVLRFNEMHVSDIMTPRPVVFTLPESMPLPDFPEAIKKNMFSRIPVYGKNPDDITGLVLRSEVLLECLENGDEKTLADYKIPLPVTSELASLDNLFRQLIKDNVHIMMATDEFGTFAGVVTLEDVLETILGFEILDENDKYADMQELARKLWKERAEKMGIELPADQR